MNFHFKFRCYFFLKKCAKLPLFSRQIKPIYSMDHDSSFEFFNTFAQKIVALFLFVCAQLGKVIFQ